MLTGARAGGPHRGRARAELAGDLPPIKSAPEEEIQRESCVLVIDDDPSARDLLTRFLVKEGFAVRTAPDGASVHISIADTGIGMSPEELYQGGLRIETALDRELQYIARLSVDKHLPAGAVDHRGLVLQQPFVHGLARLCALLHCMAALLDAH